MQEDNTKRAWVWFRADSDDYWTEISPIICSPITSSPVTKAAGTVELSQRQRDNFERFMKKVFEASQDSGPFSKFVRIPTKPYTYPRNKRRT